MTGAVYRTRTIKRERRTAAAVEQLDNQIIGVLAEDHPQSVRHVFYRMTDPRLPEPVEKSERGYRHVQDRVKKLRRSGRVPYGWIADATRRGYHTDTFGGTADFLRRVSSLYRADLWAQSSVYIEVWCESRSIAGVIQDTCEELAVSLYPAGGFSSITLAYEAANSINYHCQDARECVVFYVGDYDPAGVLIDQALERELREHLDPAIRMSFIRLGITERQIREYDLPGKPRKETDRRALHIRETVEAEAMPARLLRELLREQIEFFLPAGALHAVKVAEQSEREQIERLAEILGGEA
ncbi:hypothetical protein [Haematobacter genomosp. 1]|uniref:Uncharacterized protein n=1 Tax=Haematobacter genomosp. 1 TaxID=366618 RepID=A0A212A6G7_9RHOB|nr:hypothetical protein [Haematobacter genomosp. 1]OWJ74616.1 hypothetical protein CDV49_19060 [Haematobacter genomosp. 1]